MTFACCEGTEKFVILGSARPKCRCCRICWIETAVGARHTGSERSEKATGGEVEEQLKILKQ